MGTMRKETQRYPHLDRQDQRHRRSGPVQEEAAARSIGPVRKIFGRDKRTKNEDYAIDWEAPSNPSTTYCPFCCSIFDSVGLFLLFPSPNQLEIALQNISLPRLPVFHSRTLFSPARHMVDRFTSDLASAAIQRSPPLPMKSSPIWTSSRRQSKPNPWNWSDRSRSSTTTNGKSRSCESASSRRSNNYARY